MLIERAQLYDELTTGRGLGATADGDGEGAGPGFGEGAGPRRRIFALEDDSSDERSNSGWKM